MPSPVNKAKMKYSVQTMFERRNKVKQARSIKVMNALGKQELNLLRHERLKTVVLIVIGLNN